MAKTHKKWEKTKKKRFSPPTYIFILQDCAAFFVFYTFIFTMFLREKKYAPDTRYKLIEEKKVIG